LNPELLLKALHLQPVGWYKENRTSINLHCVGCGKYKDKRSLSPKCTVCLFGMTTKEAIKKGFIQV